MAKNSPYQNFPSIYSLIFWKRTIRITSIQKLGRFIVAFGSYRSKTLKLALNGHNSAIPWPKIRHLRIFPAYRVWFSERGPSEQIPYQKLGRFIVAFGSYRPKTLKIGLKWTKFRYPMSKNFFDQKIFSGHLSHVQTNFMQKIRKKNWTVKAVGPECTYERTYGRTRVNL